jgi:hypothetical protein
LGGAPAGGQGQRPAGVQGSLKQPAQGDARGGRGVRPTVGEVHTDRRERLRGDPSPGEGRGPGPLQDTGCTSRGLGAGFWRKATALWAPSMGWGRPGCAASHVGGLGIIRSDPAALAGAYGAPAGLGGVSPPRGPASAGPGSSARHAGEVARRPEGLGG